MHPLVCSIRPFLMVTLMSALGMGQVGKAPVPQASQTPQTPRQAILEVITAKDSSVIERHLPEATRMFWSSRLSSLPSIFSTAMATTMMATATSDSGGIMVHESKPDPNLETFQAGDVLFRKRDPVSHNTEELRIDNDDFNGDEDTMELSYHQISADGQDVLPIQLPSIRVNMKLENRTWRFEEIDFVERLRLGDPAFAKKTAHQESEMNETLALDTVKELAYAEKKYSGHSPGGGFTCSVDQLGKPRDKSDSAAALDASIKIAEHKGYKIQLSNCDANGFRVAALPSRTGDRTFCADQSAIIKESAKGPTDCFENGKEVQTGK